MEEEKTQPEEKAITEKEVKQEAAPPEEKTAEQELEEQIAELKEQHLRDHAEMENFRKRMIREMEKARLFAVESFARDLLEVMDNMRRALAVLEEGDEQKSAQDARIKDGISMTLRGTESVLARHGITRIKAEGEIFDPNQHEALYEISATPLPPGTVAQIVEEGYMIGTRLLRPARVGVAAAKNPPLNEKAAAKNPPPDEKAAAKNPPPDEKKDEKVAAKNPPLNEKEAAKNPPLNEKVAAKSPQKDDKNPQKTHKR